MCKLRRQIHDSPCMHVEQNMDWRQCGGHQEWIAAIHRAAAGRPAKAFPLPF